MSLFGGGLVGGLLSGVAGAALDTFMSGDDVLVQPIPTFYFSVEIMDNVTDYKPPEVATSFGGADTSLGGNLLGAAQGLVATSNSLFNENENWWEKAFIDISGMEMGVDSEQKQMGGYNYPLDLPTKMKSPNVTLKRLYRPKNADEVWSVWIKETLEAMAMWETPITTKIMSITLFHPNLNKDGSPFILWVGTFYNAYPVKRSFGTFNSTSEDLMTEEIEVAYSNMTGLKP